MSEGKGTEVVVECNIWNMENVCSTTSSVPTYSQLFCITKIRKNEEAKEWRKMAKTDRFFVLSDFRPFVIKSRNLAH